MDDGRIIEAGPAQSRRPPWGLVGMLVIVAAVEFTLAGHDLDLTAVWHWDWRTSGSLAGRKQARRDVLLFGDSLMKFGVMPAPIRDRTGKSAYNFALHTGQTSSSYFMLRRTLRAGGKPSAVVLDVTPHMFFHMPEENARLWPELLNPLECLDLARSMRDPGFLGSTTLASFLPSVKERYEIRSAVVAWIKGVSVSRRAELPMYRRNWRANDGAQLMAYNPPPPIDPAHWEERLYSKWRPHPVNVAYLDRFLALSLSSGARTYWLLPPIHPDVQARTDASGFDADYTRFVESVRARFPGLIVLDARHSGFPGDWFYDGIHLNRRGALRLSDAIGEAIGEAKSGWVKLDPGRVRAVESPMEDVAQSEAALRGGPELRRR